MFSSCLTNETESTARNLDDKKKSQDEIFDLQTNVLCPLLSKAVLEARTSQSATPS